MASKSVYVVSWQYHNGEVFSYAVLMTDREATQAQKFLQRKVSMRELKRAAVVDTTPEPISMKDLTQIFREEFEAADKEWAP